MLFSVYVCCILFQPFNGYIYELFGRRAPLTLCPFGTALLISILPQTAPYFSLCVIVRSLLSYFNGFLVTSPLIADYIKNESRGQAASFQAIGSLCGEIFAMMVLIGLTINMDVGESYAFVAAITACLALVLFCLIREPTIKDPKLKRQLKAATAEEEAPTINEPDEEPTAEMTKCEKIKYLTAQVIELI